MRRAPQKREDPKNPAPAARMPASFRKLHNPELPVITISSRANIVEIRQSVINYCLQRDLGRISRALITGQYETPTPNVLDETKIGNDAAGAPLDPYDLYLESHKAAIKTSAIEERTYTQSKAKLLGILTSMVNTELEEKLTNLFATQAADRTEAAVRIALTDLPPEEHLAAINALPTIDPDDPLQTWTNTL